MRPRTIVLGVIAAAAMGTMVWGAWSGYQDAPAPAPTPTPSVTPAAATAVAATPTPSATPEECAPDGGRPADFPSEARISAAKAAAVTYVETISDYGYPTRTSTTSSRGPAP